MGTALARRRAATVVLVLALVDWALAAVLTVTTDHDRIFVPLLVVAASTVVALQQGRVRRVLRSYRRVLAQGSTSWDAAEQALSTVWSARGAQLALREPRLMWSVVLLVRGGRDKPPGAASFAGFRDGLASWIVIGSVAVVELVVVALLPLPAVVDRVLLVLGLWGLAVVAGVTAALAVHPHLVEQDRVVLRFGFWDRIDLPRPSIVRVSLVSGWSRRGLHVEDGVATLSPSGATNVRLTLAEPVSVAGRDVTEVRAWVDHPSAFRSATQPPDGPGR